MKNAFDSNSIFFSSWAFSKFTILNMSHQEVVSRLKNNGLSANCPYLSSPRFVCVHKQDCVNFVVEIEIVQFDGSWFDYCLKDMLEDTPSYARGVYILLDDQIVSFDLSHRCNQVWGYMRNIAENQRVM